MPRRRSSSQPLTVQPTLSADKTYSAIKKELEALQNFKNKPYRDTEAEETQWQHLTQSIIQRGFGDPSSNLKKFYWARDAGEHALQRSGIDHGRKQRNFEARIREFEPLLKSILAELELPLPEKEVQGAYSAGEEYEFYRDVKSLLQTATNSIFIIDPYLGTEMFDIYVDGVARSVNVRILSANVSASLLTVAQKYATGGNLQLRSSNAIHDRVIFSDDRVWMVGQSIKDAAKKKPTYIVEHDVALQRPIYEDIWLKAAIHNLG